MWNSIRRDKFSLVSFPVNSLSLKKMCEVFYDNWIWMILNMKSGYHPLWIISILCLIFFWLLLNINRQVNDVYPAVVELNTLFLCDRAVLIWKCRRHLKWTDYCVYICFISIQKQTVFVLVSDEQYLHLKHYY